MLKDFFWTPLYARISSNRIVLRNVLSGKEMTFVTDQPFTHPRMLIGHFVHAEMLLKKAIQQLLVHSLLKPAPSILMHPLENLEGGLSQIEERVLREMALGSGARKAVIWTGSALSDNEVIDKLRQR
jgi:rod shape-determining protein MreB and related proteins